MYSGVIEGIGPRYCPSIEDKIMRFPDKATHQVFIPEGLHTLEVYVQGMSTSLPMDVQLPLIRSVVGLENAEIMRFGYAVEYDFVFPEQLSHSLETKPLRGLFLAGQINGTSGYEEAAAQGIVAGINAARRAQGRETVTIGREQAYIGVLIDDLVTKGTLRAVSHDDVAGGVSAALAPGQCRRAPHAAGPRGRAGDRRALDSALPRSEIRSPRSFSAWRPAAWQPRSRGLHCGLRHARDERRQLPRSAATTPGHVRRVAELDAEAPAISREAAQQVEIQVKYEGYLKRQEEQVRNFSRYEAMRIPVQLDYGGLVGISNESQRSWRAPARPALARRPVSWG